MPKIESNRIMVDPTNKARRVYIEVSDEDYESLCEADNVEVSVEWPDPEPRTARDCT